ncbi:hypothetical protein HK405_003057 [Cladochytrium tenue]|nr:hypothetical protein HK405_003057 [Cladochytrium tenue]
MMIRWILAAMIVMRGCYASRRRMRGRHVGRRRSANSFVDNTWNRLANVLIELDNAATTEARDRLLREIHSLENSCSARTRFR